MDTSLFDSLGGAPQLDASGTLPDHHVLSGHLRATRSRRTLLDSLLLDRRAETPLLCEPRLGSFTNDSTVRVIYQLGEAPDTVWLTFAEDTATASSRDSCTIL